MDFFNFLKTKFHKDLDEQQRQAVCHKEGPALVLAGPGSGKTTVITARTAFLIFSGGINPGSILTMTFNRAAKAEMEKRFLNSFASHITQKVHFSTLHSFCNLVVRDYEIKQGKRLKRIEGGEEAEDSKRKIIKGIVHRINGSNMNDDELEDLINKIGFVKNKMLKKLDETGFGIKNFQQIFDAYEEFKKLNLLMDFDDMLTYAYNILLKCPEILGYYQNKYRYVQVDEGQDLSKIQVEIVKLLVKPESGNLMVVADDDQSIYGFRGAEPEYVLDFEKQFGKSKIYRLESNYRSTGNIVEISSSFIKNNQKRYEKSHKTSNSYKENPLIVRVKDEYAQLEFLVDEVKSKENEGKTVAVLYRNNLSSIAIADAFERRDISFKIKQNKLFFFNHWIVSDILAFLRFSQNQCDFQSLARIYYRMNRYISKSMLEQAANCSFTESILDGILKLSEVKPYQQRIISELKMEFKSLAKIQPLHALDYIEFEFRYFDNVKEYCENTGLSFDYLYSLYGILRMLAQNHKTIPAYLQRIGELEEMFNRKNEGMPKKKVSMTTMHSSKGLEYDSVFMVDLLEKEIPGSKAIELSRKNSDNTLLEEERRLFYVGMTRAREDLYMIYPGTRNESGESRALFVDEVLKCMNQAKMGEIGEGLVVTHPHFGEGVVVTTLEHSDEKVIIEIDFNGIRRKLDLFLCLEKGLLKY